MKSICFAAMLLCVSFHSAHLYADNVDCSNLGGNWEAVDDDPMSLDTGFKVDVVSCRYFYQTKTWGRLPIKLVIDGPKEKSQSAGQAANVYSIKATWNQDKTKLSIERHESSETPAAGIKGSQSFSVETWTLNPNDSDILEIQRTVMNFDRDRAQITSSSSPRAYRRTSDRPSSDPTPVPSPAPELK